MMEAIRPEEVACPRCGAPAEALGGGRYRCVNAGCGHEFPSMNIFISYGHPESMICQRIMEALNARGHRTWFDTLQIPHGQDWRDEIAKGIETSDGVLSCLSKHSVRDPGVCRDELSIAIGMRGGNIKTILLEPEAEVRPPASVCHLQWLDMSDWQTRYQEDGAKFEEWFSRKMEQLFTVIESPESVAFTGQIASIREKLYVSASSARQRYLLNQFFVGREWLTERLENWLDDPDGERLCVLYGDPGVGKSAFAAHYIHYNPRVAAWLFCEYDQPHYSDAKTVIMTLAFQLACRLPGYRRALLAMLDQEKRLMELSAPELFNRLLTEPLTNYIDGGHETLCVVVDGLDESSPEEKNVLADTLGRLTELLPKWLRVLVTARKAPSVTSAFADRFHIDLRGGLAQNLADVREYFTKTLQGRFGQEPGWSAALDALVERSGGIFLYAKLVSDGVLNGKLSMGDPSGFPQGLSKAFYEWFRWYFPDGDEYRRDFCRQLGVLMASPGPLPRAELCRVFPDWDENNVKWFTKRVQVFLQEDENDFGEKTLAFTHRYISEWLEREDNDAYGSSRGAAVQTMAKRFYALFQEDVEELTPFEALHVAPLLEQSGMKKAWREVTLNHDLLRKIVDAGDHCKAWGKLDTAMTYYARAQAMGEAMCRERNESEDRRGLGVCYDRVADVLSVQGEMEKALALYEKSQAIRKALVQEHGMPEARRDLSISYDKIANILREQGRLEKALTLYEKALAICEALAQERNTPEARRDLSVSYDKVADILNTQGELERPMTLYEKALAIREALVQERNTPDDRRDLSISYNNMANILREQSELEKALILYEKFQAICEALVQERNTPDDRRALSVSYHNVAGILRKQGELEKALTLYEKALAIRETLVQEQNTPEARGNLSASYHNVADILSEQGELEKALTLYEKALAIQEVLAQEQNTPGARRNLGVIYDSIANILKAQGELEKALALYEKALAICEALAQERKTPDDRRDLSISYDNVANILMIQGELERALTLYEKSLAIRKALTQERNTPDDRRVLSIGYHNIANVLKAQGELAKALTLYEESLAIAEALVQQHGTTFDFALIVVALYMGAPLQPERNKREQMLRRGLEISRKLYQQTRLIEYRDFRDKFERLLNELPPE